MKQTKHISIILVISFLFPLVVGIGNEFYTIDSASPYEMEIELLQKINILSGDFNGEEAISRAEFAYAVSKILFPDIAFSQRELIDFFQDVPNGNPYHSQLYILKELRVISGYSDRSFRPDSPITGMEAVAMLIKALSYEPYAMSRGGYPSGYYAVAKSAGFLKGVTVTEISLIGNEAAKLLCNALLADLIVMDVISDSNPVFHIDTSKNILKQVFKIQEYDAVILNDCMSSLDGSLSPGEGRIIVRDQATGIRMVLNVTDTEIYNHMGSRLRLFVKEDADALRNEIVCYGFFSGFSETMLLGRNIVRVTDSYLEYEIKESDRLGRFTFKSPYVLINGVKRTSYQPEELIIEDGFLLLTDYEGDGKIDLIRGIQFNYHMIVSDFSEEEERISCKINPQNNVELAKSGQCEYRIYIDGKPSELSEIIKDDVISVAKSESPVNGNDLYYLYVNRETVEGKVDMLTEKGFAINESEYYLSATFIRDYRNMIANLSPGSVGLFYLNVLGEVMYFDQGKESGRNYCYLINIGKNSEDMDGGVIVKYFSDNGEITIGVLSSKATIDGKKLDGKKIDGSAAGALDEVRELLCVRPDGSVDIPTAGTAGLYNKTETLINPRPAIIKVNAENVIMEIDTDAPTYNDYTMEISDDSVLTAGTRLVKNVLYRSSKGVGALDGSFCITGNTEVLAVPDVDRYNLANEVKRFSGSNVYSIINTNIFERDLNDEANYIKNPTLQAVYYDIQGYNINPDTGEAGLVVIRGERPILFNANDYTFSVFDRISKVYDAKEDKSVYRMYYYTGGMENSALLDPERMNVLFRNIIFGGKSPNTITNPGQSGETATYYDIEPLKQGDLIFVHKVNGAVSHIQREIEINRINYKYMQSALARNPLNSIGYTAATNTNGYIPLDMRQAGLTGANANDTSSSAMHMAMDLRETALLGARVINPGNIYSFGYAAHYIIDGAASLRESYIHLPAGGITVVEEVAHFDDGSCEYRIKRGGLADLRLANSYAADGFYKASRVYTYSYYGVVQEAVIYNLSEAHNRITD